MADLFSGASAQSTPSVFNFGTHAVRIVVRDGEPWFVASDVCATLGYRDAEKGTRNLGSHQKADTQIVGTSSNGTDQARRVTIINESGLYRLVLRSRKPEAEKFSDWVTGEVLPSIRKTGRYEEPSAQPQPTLRGRRWLISTDAHGVETVQPIGEDDFITSWSRLVKDIASGECLRSSAELVNMANACTARLQQRMNQEASRANAVLFRQTAPGRLERVEHA